MNIIVLDTDALPGSDALIPQITGYEFMAKGYRSVGTLLFIGRTHALALVVSKDRYIDAVREMTLCVLLLRANV
jgi:hypothetical protein